MEDHLEAMSEVTSCGADFEAFRKFMEVHSTHWDALWEEYTKPRWARLRMNLYGGRQRAFANFFNQLSSLKEDESQRLVVAYGAGRLKTQKRGYASSNDENVQGVCTAFCYDTCR